MIPPTIYTFEVLHGILPRGFDLFTPVKAFPYSDYWLGHSSAPLRRAASSGMGHSTATEHTRQSLLGPYRPKHFGLTLATFEVSVSVCVVMSQPSYSLHKSEPT